MTDKQEMKEKDERKERPEMIPRTMSNIVPIGNGWADDIVNILSP